MALWANDRTTDHKDSFGYIELVGQEVLPAVREIGRELGLDDPFSINAPISLAQTSRAPIRSRSSRWRICWPGATERVGVHVLDGDVSIDPLSLEHTQIRVMSDGYLSAPLPLNLDFKSWRQAVVRVRGEEGVDLIRKRLGAPEKRGHRIEACGRSTVSTEYDDLELAIGRGILGAHLVHAIWAHCCEHQPQPSREDDEANRCAANEREGCSLERRHGNAEYRLLEAGCRSMSNDLTASAADCSAFPSDRLPERPRPRPNSPRWSRGKRPM
jgi:hypothetical protein